jgi:hypothetical protein
LVIEQGQLSEELASPKDCHGQLAASGTGMIDANLPARDQVEDVSRVTLLKDRLSSAEGAYM